MSRLANALIQDAKGRKPAYTLADMNVIKRRQYMEALEAAALYVATLPGCQWTTFQIIKRFHRLLAIGILMLLVDDGQIVGITMSPQNRQLH